MPSDFHIALIDDDPDVLDALRLYLERNGVRTSCFSNAKDFLATSNLARAFDCVVTDLRMPGISGIDLIRQMKTRAIPYPIILITAYGDISMAVRAIKLGAFDFLEKPFDEEQLLGCIRKAIYQEREAKYDAAELSELQSRVQRLTERQREVMQRAAEGLSNKEIALRLNISPRTVEFHRAWVMERMHARNLAELVRMVMQLKTLS